MLTSFIGPTAVVFRNSSGEPESTLPAPAIDYIALAKNYANDHDRLRWASLMADARDSRLEFERKILEKAEKTCPLKPGDKVRLKKPWRKASDGVVDFVASAEYDAATLACSGDWTVRLRMLKSDGEPGAVTLYAGADDLA